MSRLSASALCGGCKIPKRDDSDKGQTAVESERRNFIYRILTCQGYICQFLSCFTVPKHVLSHKFETAHGKSLVKMSSALHRRLSLTDHPKLVFSPRGDQR